MAEENRTSTKTNTTVGVAVVVLGLAIAGGLFLFPRPRIELVSPDNNAAVADYFSAGTGDYITFEWSVTDGAVKNSVVEIADNSEFVGDAVYTGPKMPTATAFGLTEAKWNDVVEKVGAEGGYWRVTGHAGLRAITSKIFCFEGTNVDFCPEREDVNPDAAAPVGNGNKNTNDAAAVPQQADNDVNKNTNDAAAVPQPAGADANKNVNE